MVADFRPPTSFGSQHGCQSIPLNLLVVMVSSIGDESARIVGTYFHAKTKTLQVDPSQKEPYFEVMILNSYL